jgi:predicted phage replisome organizer
MGQNKRYFWLKLFDDFFSSKRIKKLRNLAGGDTYTIIYLKMQLKALKNDGYLYFDGVMGDFAEEIALDIDENPDDVKVTIQYLLSVGLIESSESGEEWYLTYMKNCIGSETASAQRSRAFRQRQKEQKVLQCNTDETLPQHAPNVEKEIEIEKEKDINNKKEKSIKHKYGEYGHITLTDEQYDRLISDYGEIAVLAGIKKVDEYCQEHGKSYKDYNLTLRKWGITAPKLKQTTTKEKITTGLDKVVVLAEDDSNSTEWEEDRKNHPYDDGWRMNDDGYWVNVSI